MVRAELGRIIRGLLAFLSKKKKKKGVTSNNLNALKISVILAHVQFALGMPVSYKKGQTNDIWYSITGQSQFQELERFWTRKRDGWVPRL